MPDTEADDEAGEHELSDADGRPRRHRSIPFLVIGALALLALGLGLGIAFAGTGGVVTGPEGVPLQQVPQLASPNSTASGTPVGGITCRTSMDASDPYHVHAHIAIFVNGHQRRVPAGVGIPEPRLEEHLSNGLFMDAGPTNCLYWLHVHSNDGIIHVEAPSKMNFTLGQFFDIWQQPLGPQQVGPAHGPVVAFVNGKRFNGDPRDIPLASQSVIQLDVGSPVVPYRPLHFKVTGLCASTAQCASGH